MPPPVTPVDPPPADVPDASDALADASSPVEPLDASVPDEVDAGAPCDPPTGKPGALKLTQIASGLNAPLFVAAAPGDDRRLFVLEQSGVIRLIRDGALIDEPFLDISERVATYVGEDGLLGIAFHPDYANNGRFFIHYSTEQIGVAPVQDAGVQDGGAQDAAAISGGSSGDAGVFIPQSSSIISEFRRGQDADHADVNSERRLLAVEQRWTNHNAGMLEFSPADGFLYIALGDGDGIGDAYREAQNLSRVTGKLLRIDVDTRTPGLPYGVPPGNMTGAGVRPEIWSYGLRNPWRFSFDRCNNDLYIGDVGQSRMEEINYEPGNETGGRNYGWNTVEGTLCYSPRTDCDMTGVRMPIWSYLRTEGCSVTSGYVYRGTRIPWLRGAYIYGDYCVSRFASFRVVAGAATEHTDLTPDLNPEAIAKFNSFGVDNAGEMYAVSGLGAVYRIDPQ